MSESFGIIFSSSCDSFMAALSAVSTDSLRRANAASFRYRLLISLIVSR